MKKIIYLVILAITFVTCISLGSMHVEANETQNMGNIKNKRSSEKYSLTVTKSYFLTADDANTEKKVTYSYPCGAINVEITNPYNPPLSAYVEGKGLSFASSSLINVKPVPGCTIINFSLNFSSQISWSFYIKSNIVTENVSKCEENGDMYSITITPTDASKAAEIYNSAKYTGFLGFSVTYSYLHDHNPTWMTEEENHWKECECGLSEYTTEKEPHNFNEEVSYLEPTHTVVGEKVLRCECGREKSVEVPALGHTQTDVWQSDDFNHWKECECTDPATEFDKAEHKWLFKETVNEPSIEEVGRAVYYCESCGREKEDLSYLNVTDANIKIEAVNSLTYTGKEQSQKLNVYYDDVELTEGIHYTLSGNDATNAGDYVLNITGIGTFRGETTFDYSIAKAPLTISVENYEITYGDLAPTFAVSYIGFVNEETETVLEGALSFACEYDQFDDVNEYVITASGLSSNNYEITYVNGEVTVKPKEITGVEWSNLEFVYNGETHNPTASVNGLINEDDCAVELSAPQLNAGTYTSTVIGLTNSNYKLPKEVLETSYVINPKSILNATITLGDSLVYTGEELTQLIKTVVLDDVTLVENVDYTIEGNKATNAGDDYTLVILGKGNYTNSINKEFVIAKQKVELPTSNTGLVYTGATLTGVETSNLYNVENGSFINVGTYIAEVELKDTTNYEWAEEFDGKVAWTITKATYDMSGIKFENVTVTYDGSEHVIEITGTLPEGVTVAYTNNKGTKAGTYNATAKFTYDTANYNTIADMNAVLTINKFKVALPETTTSFIYDGTAKVAIAAHYLYTVEGATETVVGSYEATVTLNDKANYEWAEEFNGKVAWTITKATYDMSGIKFENVTVTYDGSEHVIEITGTLPEGVTVAYTNNKGTKAGTYNATAKFTYDTANYNTIADMNAVLTINKAKVELPEATTSFVYDGTAKVAVAAHDLYTVEGATATVVGSYEATVTLNDKANYEWAEEFNGKVAWTITKATYDMSGIKFENVTVTYDGSEHKVEITGTLPAGVTVAYTTNKGTNAGTYNATAKFTYDTANYNAIPDMNATITINKATYDMSGVTFDDVTVVYDGSEHKVLITGTLPTGVTVSYEDNVGTNVGVYNTVATFTYDTANYNTIEDMNAVLTINKATYDMSGIKFENVTVVYNGTEYVIEIAGTLPEGVTVSYTNNKGTNAGTYNAVATFTYDTANYNTIADMNAVLTINKVKVELPEATTIFVYDGTAKVAVASHDLYTVTEGSATNAGSYEAVITLKDTANYEWAEEFNGKVAWTITKATYDMSSVKFENVTVTYDGAEHKVEITGTLPEGVIVAYTTNKGTNAGTYNATATFTYDTANYNTIADMNAVLTINKAKVELPEATTSFVYDGTAKVAVASHDLYTVEGATETVVGSYEATVTLNDKANYEWAEEFNGKVAWTITKATYDMSSVKFENVTVTYDGAEHKVEITGTLPEGVIVAYTTNKGTNAGTYNATATFTYDTANYNTIVDMNAVLTINTDEHSYVNPETNVEEVIVSTEDGTGIDPNKEVKIEMVEAEVSSESFDEFLDKKERVAIAYDVKLIQDGVEVKLDGTLKIKILIPEELRDREFGIMHVHNGDETYMLEYEIEGDYVVFYTDKLSSFVFVYETGSILWLLIVFAVIVILEAGLLVFLLNKKKQFKLVKLAAAYPPFVFGMFVPEWHIVLIIVFAIIVAALAAVDIVYALSFFGFRSKANSETEEEQMIVIEEEVEEPVAEEVTEEPQQAVEEVVETEPVVEESIEDDDDEDVMQVWDEETHSFTIIRIIKSFTARLIQSKDEVKDYYDIIKNELLSYKKVKSRISFKHEAFKFGKDNVARLRFRGKTLCLYLALNPADYENTKYKIEDMSAISNSSDVPTMYRINLPRRADYAKELIYDLMKKLGAERMDINYKEYSKEYPYEDNEALLEKGLIKKSVKVIGNGTSTKTLVNPVNIVKKVSASEVNNLITDEQVIELIEQSTRIADKTKKTIINIDTLSQYFNENETVTLEEIKKRIPNVEKKATYYKVLARGILDKPLTVDADDFSIEAEKMIIVTGGKVLVSKAK